MRKYIVLFLILTVVLAVPAQARLPFLWGGQQAPVLHVQADTTAYSAAIAPGWKNCVTVSGAGILHQVIFNSSSASKDPYVRITMDGVVDSVTEASAEEVTRYVVPASGTNLSAAGTEDIFAAVDSTNAGGVRLDLPFSNGLKIEARDEDGSAVTRVITIWSAYE